MTTPTTPAADAHKFGAYSDKIGHWSDGPETFVICKAKHVQLGAQTYGPPQAVDSREAALIAERDQLRAAIEVCLSFVHADDRSKPSTDPDLCGEIVRVRLSGLCALAEAVTPGIRLAAHQAFVARTLDALSAPAVEGV